MSLTEACWLTLQRTIVLCLLAWPVLVCVERYVRGVSDARRPFVFAVLLSPFLFPELLVGYTFRNLALLYPRSAELLCAALLFIRIVPIGVVALLASPSSLTSAAAIHCRWMLARSNWRRISEWRELAACYWHGPVRRMMPALGLMALVAFQEFELSALLQTTSWTDWFITAQRLGLSRDQQLRQALWPLLMQLPLLMGIVVWLGTKTVSRTDQNESLAQADSPWIGIVATIYLGLALTGGCLIPMGIVAVRLPEGLSLLIRQPTQWMGVVREIAVASTVSVCAGMTTWAIGGMWARAMSSARSTVQQDETVVVGRRRRVLSNTLKQGFLLPGLIGSLLISLVTVEIFQSNWLHLVYDSPLPWVLGLVVWLLPRAALLHLWLGAFTRSEAVHIAEMLAKSDPRGGDQISNAGEIGSTISEKPSRKSGRISDLLFRLRDQPRLLGISLICYWAYLDLPTAYLLAPMGMPSGLVRLYNFMHFGRSAALSAESLLFFGTPLLALWSFGQFFRLWNRRSM